MSKPRLKPNLLAEVRAEMRVRSVTEPVGRLSSAGRRPRLKKAARKAARKAN